jgi:hypothetical protein
MANYTAATRTNYFRVKDAVTFEAWCHKHGLEFWKQAIEGLGACYAITADTFDDHGWSRDDPDTNEPLDVPAELAKHLAPTDVAILYEVGSEKLRYLSGYAIAVAPNGRIVSVSIHDIDEVAREAFPNLTITAGSY